MVPSQLVNKLPQVIPRVPLAPPGAPPIESLIPPVRSKSSATTEEPYSFLKKVYKRVAAGMVWEDPTLAEWDPSTF